MSAVERERRENESEEDWWFRLWAATPVIRTADSVPDGSGMEVEEVEKLADVGDLSPFRMRISEWSPASRRRLVRFALGSKEGRDMVLWLTKKLAKNAFCAERVIDGCMMKVYHNVCYEHRFSIAAACVDRYDALLVTLMSVIDDLPEMQPLENQWKASMLAGDCGKLRIKEFSRFLPHPHPPIAVMRFYLAEEIRRAPYSSKDQRQNALVVQHEILLGLGDAEAAHEAEQELENTFGFSVELVKAAGRIESGC